VPRNVVRGPDGKLRKPPEGVPGEGEGGPGVPGLSNRVDDELVAIEHVYTHGPDADETWQQKNLRAVKDTSPIQFLNLRLKLQDERKPPPGVSGAEGSAPDQKWDGQGPCPCCGYEKERPIEDEGTAKILAMLAELDGRGEGEGDG
jgi:hypothetical protein